MIAQIFPKKFQRYLSLPVLGPLMDSYAIWLNEQQYTLRSSKYELRMAAHICEFLKRQGFQRVEDVGEEDLKDCYQLFRKKFPKEAGSVKALERFFVEHAGLRPPPIPELSRKEIHLNAFMAHLRDNCGYVSSTIKRQVNFAGEFLD